MIVLTEVQCCFVPAFSCARVFEIAFVFRLPAAFTLSSHGFMDSSSRIYASQSWVKGHERCKGRGATKLPTRV